MTQPETCINQTLLIWCAVVVVEIFVIAHLMSFPWLILTAIVIYWPGKAAMDWPMEEDDETNIEKSEDGKTVPAKS